MLFEALSFSLREGLPVSPMWGYSHAAQVTLTDTQQRKFPALSNQEIFHVRDSLHGTSFWTSIVVVPVLGIDFREVTQSPVV